MDEFKTLYSEVFDENGNVRNCGREKCKKLINACQTMYEEKYGKTKDFGNNENGFMKIKAIKNFAKKENLL